MSADKRRRALIFDFDGLILDTETVEVEIWTEIYAQYGMTFDMEAYQGVIGSSGARGFDPAQPLVDREGETRSVAEIRKDFLQTALRYCEKLNPMEGAAELIRGAKADGYLVAVGSSAAHWWLETHLTRLGLIDEFDTIVSSEDVENAKPQPDIFLKVLENLSIPPEDALVLEDSNNGVLAAHRAGIRAIAVPNPITKGQDFSLAAAIVPSLAHFNPDLYF
ncbi:MAG: HAD-IA family hydrolase [Chloroflexi bacterium]|nr:HAD-IA family hydrolase [Chloroflexota bacterium]